jgi:transposase
VDDLQNTIGALRFEVVDRSQSVLLPVDIEELIPSEHCARQIWNFVGRLKLDAFVDDIKAVEGQAGRDAIHPRLLISIWIYAITRGIHSAREIERQMRYEPGLQWLAGLRVINHHTLSDFRSRRERALRELFEQVIAVLHMNRLVTLERVTQDGTKIRANVNKKTFSRESKLRANLQLAREQMEYLERQAAEEQTTRKQKAARLRAARERSERLEQALEEIARLQQEKKHRRDQPVQASSSDADAQFMRTSDHGLAPSLNMQLSVDGAHGFIVDVEVVKQPSDSAELEPAMERLKERFGMYPQQAIADGDYTNHEAVLGMAERKIDFYGSWTGRAEGGGRGRGCADRSPAYDACAFHYDGCSNEMICPQGKRLVFRTVQHPHAGADSYVYMARGEACRECPAREVCCPNTRIGKYGRTASITVRAPDVEEFDRKMGTPAGKQIYRLRSRLAEFPNLWIKEKLKFRRFSVRGRLKAQCEALLHAVTYNIQKLFRIRPALAT